MDHQCGVCGVSGMITPATHELRYRRDSAEERDYAQFVCEDCLTEMPLSSDDLYQKEDYVRLG